MTARPHALPLDPATSSPVAAEGAAPPRLAYFAAAIATVGLGLASRKWPVLGPAPGDVLYATLIYWGMRWLGPHRRRTVAGLGALAFCVAVEASQLWQGGWLDAVRATRLGGLVLGHGFLWGDIAWYGLGVLLGLALDRPGWFARAPVAQPRATGSGLDT